MIFLRKLLFALIAGTLSGLSLAATAAEVTATFNTASDVPVTASSYSAAGSTVDFALNFAPPIGTNLTVLNNTGLGFIQGNFDNLQQGQQVNLTYGGLSHAFVANYYGGTGNDLVLQWANVRLLAWGSNSNGSLGDGTTTDRSVPVSVIPGVLAGKTVVQLAAGRFGSLALAADGTLAGWGGSPGDDSDSASQPVLVSRKGVLAGKTAIALSLKADHRLVLCSDGTIAAWGANSYGQLGNASTSSSITPVAVSQTGVLAGKTVVAIAAGTDHSLALCADGTLAAWGNNSHGQLGNGSTTRSAVPVLVNRSGVLSGKTVSMIDCGGSFSLALCTDGTLVSWGYNSEGELGNGGAIDSTTPVLVNRGGVLAGKSVTKIAAGGAACVVLCSDGALATWGFNSSGQLGNGSNTQSKVPVLVSRSGVLAGKRVSAISAGNAHAAALCTDGTLAAWGSNFLLSLGNDSTTDSNVPVAVATGALRGGEVYGAIECGFVHNLALAAAAPAPLASTLAATAVRNSTATLNGSASANGSATTTLTFEYGATTGYGSTVTATPASISGTTPASVSADLTDLTPGGTYHFRLVATNASGVTKGEDLTFTTGRNAVLASLAADQDSLYPAFSPAVFHYEMVVPHAVANVRFTPQASDAAATVRVNGAVVARDAASEPVPLAVGSQTVSIAVAATDGINTSTYEVRVIRRPETFAFSDSEEPQLAVRGLKAGGPVRFALDFAPAVGASLTVADNTGLDFIQGAFDDLAQGQRVDLTYGGLVYSFVANYFGGTGNDLVLEWANRRLLGWGDNSSGQLGIDSTQRQLTPQATDLGGVLAGKTIVGVSAGSGHALACCADGTVASWGDNNYGQLGNKTTATSKVPVSVDMTGILAGKTVVAVSAGYNHSLALCSDGKVAAWGQNSRGELGNKTYSYEAPFPIWVDATGVLAGKSVIAISASHYGSVALCSDGTLAAWGSSTLLGNNSSANSQVPVAVDMSGALFGKKVVAIAAGYSHCLALCSDGTLAAWGANESGQLGTNIPYAYVPVLVDRSGVLAGKSVVAIAAGAYHNLVRCSDGTLAAWGSNGVGQLGNGFKVNSTAPVLVSNTGALTGRSVASFAAGYQHTLAVCTDGSMTAWGNNVSGQLGNNSTANSVLPVAVDTAVLKSGETALGLHGGSSCSFALTALPGLPLAVTQSAGAITDSGATLAASVNANGAAATVSFEYGATTAYGAKVTAVPATVGGSAPTPVSATVAGLVSGVTYHYRVIVTSAGGTVTGGDIAFTTTTNANLASLSLSGGALASDFIPSVQNYSAAVADSTDSITVTAVAALATSTIQVNGIAVESGTASGPLHLAAGNNRIDIVVTAADGIDTLRYTVTVTRLPAEFAFASASAVPVVAGDFVPVGNARFSLTYAPSPGDVLMVVRNTGFNPIRGTFANLAQGQRVEIGYGTTSYSFVADYFGGSGNDLVLRWANTRVLAWGGGVRIPAPVDASGVLAGKSVTAVVGGSSHTLVLCADGTLAAWGYNGNGELGNGATTDSAVPVLVNRTGVLAGKTIIAVSAAFGHNIALCSDGTIATWGRGFEGQLGNGAFTTSILPVLVNRSGVLAGRTVTAVAAGGQFNLALCSDGAVVSWGSNEYGKLGIGSLTNSSVPVLVDRRGALFGKRVTAVAAGADHALAWCDDGSVAAWGNGGSGQLGNNSYADSSFPVLVDRSGVLAGKSIVEVVSGGYHSLVRCADGTLAAWGSDNDGQLGNNSTFSGAAPVSVYQAGVLAGKTVTAVDGGTLHSLALCSDGTMAAWGFNDDGQLGNNSTAQSTVPVLVNASKLRTGERVMSVSGGSYYSAALVASPLQSVTTAAATSITGASAVLHGFVNANFNTVTPSFEYGPDTNYGSVFMGTPSAVSGNSNTAVGATVTGLLPGTTYHFRLSASGIGGTARGGDLTFTTLSDNAQLASLGLSQGVLDPRFDKLRTSYAVTVPFSTSGIAVTTVTEHAGATVKVNGSGAPSGTPGTAINLPVGNTAVAVVVTAEDGITTKTYSIKVTRLPENFVFDSATSIPVTADGFAAGGYPVKFVLNHAPVPGTVLTAVNNTGLAFISGTFGNLAQGQRVPLTFAGLTYDFVANYFGGDGNDLVLQWAATGAYAWGENNYGQLGDRSTTGRRIPAAVETRRTLEGKTIVALAGGYLHSLALCSDGTLAAWGYNIYGQLGNDDNRARSLPVEVDRTGALAGKTVIAISAGPFHNLALCSDGSIAAWGYNNYGQLGTGDKNTRRTPALVAPLGALAGKQVVGIAAGAYQSFARCSDGSVVAWGYNDEGELGDGSTATRLLPVAVDASGPLAGKKVAAISAGQYHTLALCTDGAVVAWGYNLHGELGNDSAISSQIPIAINPFGALAGKTVSAISAGGSHSLALCADGTLAAWGDNGKSQLGVGGVDRSTVPVAVGTSGKTIDKIAAGGNHNLARFTDGSLAAWGGNASGQLGNDSTATAANPSPVVAANFPAGARPLLPSAGCAALHSLAIVGLAGSSAAPGFLAILPPSENLLADPDHDGIPNLVELAFGLDPGSDSSGKLPMPQRVGENYVMEFDDLGNLAGIDVGVEASASMLPGTWKNVPDSGRGSHHVFSVPARDGALFFRWKVTK